MKYTNLTNLTSLPPKHNGGNNHHQAVYGAGGVTHPLLLHGAGAATIAAACTTGFTALSMTVMMLVLCTAMSVVYMFERDEYIRPMQAVVYLVPSVLLTLVGGLILHSLSPQTAESIGMYLPVLAADALVLSRLEEDAPFIPPTQALPEALRLWWLYAALAMPIGLLRELLGHGTVFGLPFFLKIGASSTQRTFFGFILLGFGLAIVQKLQGDRRGTISRSQ